MDHFNATVKDGKLVSTRRGLQVSRQKFNGTSFVNSCPQTTASHQSPPRQGSSKRRTPPLRFIGADSEPRQAAARAQKQGPQGSQPSFVLEVPRENKARRRGASKDRSPIISSTPSSGSSSRASSQVPSPGPTFFQLPRLDSYDFCGQIDFSVEGPIPRTAPMTPPNRPNGVSEEDWQLFQRSFACIPYRMYPYENILTHNPARGSEFYHCAVNNTMALHCALMTGSITEAILGRSAEVDPKGYADYIPKICSILTRKLDYTKEPDYVTLYCIACLAMNGCYVGRLDHWHMHMQGLQRVIDTHKRTEGSHSPWVHAKVHNADLKGAVALCTTPYLTFTRRYPDISLFLSHDTRSYTTHSLANILSPLHVSPPVITALSSLAIFAAAVRVARQSDGTVTFDPHAFTDEYLAVTQALVSWPGPLRETGGPNPFVSSGEGRTEAEKYMANHRLRPDVEIVPFGEPGVEAALRCIGLLYIKELLPDWPRNLGGYGVLLKLLEIHLEAVLDGMARDQLVDPRLRQRRGSGASMRERGESLRIALVFLAVVGDLMARIGDENEGREGAERYPREIYHRCLREGLGWVDGEEVEEEDLAVLQLFDVRNLRGESWDARRAVRELLMGL